MVMEQIDSYSVDYAQGTSQRRIGLKKGTNYIAYLFFTPDGTALPAATISNGVRHWHFHLSEYPNLIDLLRNEKPVYLCYGSPGDGTLNCITTSDEPVGDGEKTGLFRVR